MSKPESSFALSLFRQFVIPSFVCLAALACWRPSPSAGQDAAGAAAPANLTGDWTVDDGSTKYAARLVHAGNRVMGSYDYQGGRIDGTFADGVFTFAWDQPGNRRGGQSRLVIAADGKSMTGTWSYDPSVYESGLKGQGKWTLIRGGAVPKPGGGGGGGVAGGGGRVAGDGGRGAGDSGPHPDPLPKGEGTTTGGFGIAAAKEAVAKAKPKADVSKALARLEPSSVPEPPKVVPFRPQAAQVEVPNVVGLSAKEGKAALAAKGFRTAFEAADKKTPSREKAFTIRSQDPAAGTKIPAGESAKTLVTLQVYGQMGDSDAGTDSSPRGGRMYVVKAADPKTFQGSFKVAWDVTGPQTARATVFVPKDQIPKDALKSLSKILAIEDTFTLDAKLQGGQYVIAEEQPKRMVGKFTEFIELLPSVIAEAMFQGFGGKGKKPDPPPDVKVEVPEALIYVKPADAGKFLISVKGRVIITTTRAGAAPFRRQRPVSLEMIATPE